ncbi:MAG: tandem-95 repeat protein [Cyclobacteriaceae bacterium]
MNTVSVTSPTADPTPGCTTCSDTDTPDASADLSIDKMVDENAPNVGDDITFTLTVSNAGPSDASSVTVSDLLPSGYTYVSDDGGGDYNNITGEWEVGSLASGSNVSLDIMVTVLASGVYTNTATVSGNEDDPDPDNNEDTEEPTPGAIEGDISVSDVCFGEDAIVQLINFDNLPNGTYEVHYLLNSGTPTTQSGIEFISGSASFDLTNPAASSYVIEIEMLTNDSDQDLTVIVDPESFEVKETPTIQSAMGNDPESCDGLGSITLELTGVSNGIYNIDYNGGTFDNIQVTNGSATIGDLSEGQYNDISITINGCISAEDVDVELSDPELPTLALGSSTDPTVCGGEGVINLTLKGVPNGIYSFDYDGGSFDDVPVESGAAEISAMAGTYNNLTINVVDCESVDDVDVTVAEAPVPTLSVESTTQPSCNGSDGSITFSFTNVADGDYPVTFDGGSFGTVEVVSGEATISDLSQGTYDNITVEISGCSSPDGVSLELDCSPPIADDENVTISEDTPVTVSAVTGDIDPDGTIIPSTIILTDPNDPSNVGDSSTPVVIEGEGIYEVDINGNVTFTPEPNYNGVSRVNYTVEDNDGNLSNIATITVTVTPLNDGPEAVDDVESIGPDETLTATVVPNDVPDPEGDDVTYTTVSGTEPDETTEGTLTFNPDGTYEFTPVSGFDGEVTFDYEVCDDGVPEVCSIATVTIHVGTNVPPVADDETVTTDEDTQVTIDITDGDTDSDGTIVPSSIILIDPTNAGITGNSSTPLVISGEGNYSIDVDGNLTFTPEENFNGTSSVNYTIKDNLGATSNVATVTVDITPANDGPVAVDDEETMDPGTTLTSSVVLNDLPDPEGDDLTYSVVSGTEPDETTEGTLTFNPDGSYTFTAIGGFDGEVIFDYEVCDDGVPIVCSTATVTIDVTDNIPPVADNDSATADEDQEVTILVIEGDTDADGTINPGSIILIDPNDPSNTGDSNRPLEIEGEGTYEVDNVGNVTFIPEFNFNGDAQVNYTIEDNLGATSNIAEVTITVTSLNDPPVADNESVATEEDTAVSIDITEGDIDFDGNIEPTTVILIDPDNVTNIGNSSTPLTIDGEGTYSVDASGNLTFTPEDDYNGVSGVNYTIEDNDGALSNVARVDITIAPANDGPVAVDDVESVGPGEALTSTVTPNDIPDPEGDDVTYTVVSGTTPDSGTEGTLTFNDDGTYTFVPVDGFSGEVDFDYEVCDDGVPELCSTATVTIHVGDNEPPVADDETATTTEDVAVTLDITDGDTDSDGSIVPSSIVLIDPANSGVTGTHANALTIAGEGVYSINTDGNLTFTPVENFNGVSSVNYTIKDNLGATSNVATVEITITPANDAPVAIDDEEFMSPGTTLSASVTGNDLPDPEGDNLSYSLVSGTTPDAGTEGSLTFNPDGSYDFAPVSGFLGTVTFEYEVCDDGTPSLCSTATVSITVTNNEPPVADDDDAIITEDNPVTIFIINGDEDPDGTLNPFEIVLIDPADPTHTGDNTRPLVIDGEGTYTVDPLGNVTFTPEENYTGTSIINYTIEDNLGAVSNVAKITITVTPENDPPVAVDDEDSTEEDTPVTVPVLGNDTDIDGDDLEVTQASSDDGTTVINPDGTITFTPNTDFIGEAIVDYTITDGNGGFDDAIVTITIEEDRAISIVVDEVCISNTPYVDYTITPVDFSTIELATIVWRKLDGTVVEELTDQPLTGQLLWPGAELDNDGNPIAWPGWDFVDGVWIQINDGLRPEMELVVSLNPSTQVVVSYPPATPTCSANPNNPPTAGDDEIVTDEDTPVTDDLFPNDEDIDGDDFTINTTPITPPTHGDIVINPDGTFTYTPDPMYNGTDSFVYEICDTGLPSMCDQATVNINIGQVNDPPVAEDDVAETDFETPVTGDLTTNDEDPDGDNLIVSGTPVTPPTNGSVVLDTDGTYTYTPNDGFVGIDTFVYQVCDDGTPSICDEATVTITVISTNEPPVAVDDAASTDSITPVEGNLLENDSDPNGDEITVNTIPIINPFNGTVVINPDGTYIYTPDSQFEGTDTFEYEICDNGVPSLCSTAVVTIQVERAPLDVPQIFGGPNNPTWFIEGIDEYPDNHVQVFNRWGNKVFEIKGYDNNSRNWASESSVGIILGNNQVPDGTYFYVIDLGDGSKPKSGFVVVNR